MARETRADLLITWATKLMIRRGGAVAGYHRRRASLLHSGNRALLMLLSLFLFGTLTFGDIVLMRDTKPLEEWIQDAASPDRKIRTLAIRVIGSYGEDGSAAVPTLRKLLTSEEASDRRWSLAAFAEIQKATFAAHPVEKREEAWTKDLSEGTDALRATCALTRMASKTSAVALAAALNHADPCVRYFAACAMHRVVVDTISGYDNAPREERRRKIVERRKMLADLCMDKLVAMSRDRNPLLRSAAIQALGEFGFGTVVGEFGELAAPAMPVFIEALKSDDREIQYRSAAALMFMGAATKLAVPALIECAEADERRTSAPRSDDDDSGITPGAPRRLCIQAMGNIGPAAEAALPLILRALSDKDGDIRKTATGALTSIKVVPESIPILMRNLGDPSFEVRSRSASALGKTGKAGAEAVPALTTLLKDDDRMVRFCAALALRDMAPYAKSALPDLRKRLEDADAQVRIVAREAIRAIEAVDK